MNNFTELSDGADTHFLVRWRGRQEGPYSAAVIEMKLAGNEIGLLHEIFYNGDWVTIRDYVAERETVLRAEHQARVDREQRMRQAAEQEAHELEENRQAELLTEERRRLEENRQAELFTEERRRNEQIVKPMAKFKCPFCQNETPPRIEKEVNMVIFVILLLFCLPLCWIPFLDSQKKEKRKCSACGSQLG